MPQSISGQLAYEACKKFPNATSKEIARALREKHPLVFNSVEHARSLVRAYRGNHGEKNRKQNIKYMETYRPNGQAGFVAPKSFAESWAPLILDPEIKTWGIISDVHMPYHDEKALSITIEHLNKVGIKGLILNGDILDAHMLSRFQKDPRKRSFKEEIEVGREFLKSLREYFPECKIIFKQGNHERRLEDYINSHAIEIWDLDEITLQNLLRFEELDIDYVDRKRAIKISHLYILHGDELPKGLVNAVNPARGAFLRTNTICLTSHYHQTSNHTDTSMDERVTSTWSIGCLCELHPQFMPINKWNHGFAYVNIEDEDWYVENKKIIRGKVV